MLIWLKANEGIVDSNNKVIWKDASGNKFDATCTTPENPQLYPNAINGLPAFLFNGIGTGFQTPAVPTFKNKRGSIILVLKVNARSLTSSVGLGSVVSTFNGEGITWQFLANTKQFYYYDGTNGVSFNVSESILNQWQIITLVRGTDSLMDIYRNGRIQNNFFIRNNQPDINTLKIGYNGQRFDEENVKEVWNGFVAEIIVYNKALNENELDLIHRYLSKKYNIPLLPPPYYFQLWFYVLLGAVLFLLSMLIIKFIQNNRMKKKLKLVSLQQALEQERKRIARDMHDEIGSGLSRIALLSQTINQKKDNDININLQKLKNISQHLGNQLNEMIWSINPEQDKLDNLMGYIRSHVADLLEENCIDYEIEFPEKTYPFELLPEWRRNIFLITKEVINNALKYSGTKKVKLSFRVIDSDRFIYIIRDFGKGFSVEENREFGHGLKNIKHRAEEIGCEIKIDSLIHEGATVTLTGKINYYQSGKL